VSTDRYGPALIAGALIGALALVALNVAALGSSSALLRTLDLISDLLVLALGVGYLARRGMREDALAASMRAALDESKEQLAGIVDTAMDAIITVDREQRIVVFNRAAETMFRVARSDALGDRLDRFIPARFREGHRAHIERFSGTGDTRRRMGENLVLWALRADGSEFPIEASISQAGDPDRRLFTVILRDTTQRKAAEDALRQQQAELRELSARVLEAREEEKTIIARELHDELGQLLTALKMDLEWLRERMPAGETADKVGQMNTVLDRTVGSVRRIAADLRPLMLDDLGLADAASWLVEDFTQRSGIRCKLDKTDDDALDGIERGIATTIYRALQESLTNVARHSAATNAWVLLRLDDGVLRLEIEDDGRGMPPAAQLNSRSLGLKGMRERVHYHGGMLEVGHAPRGGTRVRVRLPLQSVPGAGA
jgi:PAS domain S-box-containing protein